MGEIPIAVHKHALWGRGATDDWFQEGPHTHTHTRQQRLARLRSARESSRVFFSLPPSYSSFTSLST